MKVSVEKASVIYIYIAVGWALIAGSFVYLQSYSRDEEFYINRSILFVSDGFLILCSTFLLLILARFRRIELSLAGPMFIVASLMVVASLKTLYLVGPINYLHYFGRNFLVYFFVSIVVVQAVSQVRPNNVVKIISFFYFLVIIGCLLVTILYMLVDASFFWGGSRLTGTLINHNSLAFVLAFFCIFYFFRRAYLRVVIAYFFIILSGSITGMTVIFLLAFFRPVLSLAFLASLSSVFYIFFIDQFSIQDIHFAYKVFEILSNPDTHLTSASARLEQSLWFYKYVLLDPSSWVVGVLKQDEILLFDSQYYNFVSNFGLISSLAFFGLIVYSIFRIKSPDFRAYLVWSLGALILTAFLSRWNVVLFYFFVIGAGFSMHSRFSQFYKRKSII